MGSLKHTVIGVGRVGFEIRPRFVNLWLRLGVQGRNNFPKVHPLCDLRPGDKVKSRSARFEREVKTAVTLVART